ncbi:MFS transporter [Candidatus Hydrogenedentota bacterium]
MNDQTISLSQRLAYSANPFGFGIPRVIMGAFGLIYLNQVLGLDPVMLGLVAIIPTLWDAISDPIMGSISDRTKTRWGRRRPYIFSGCVVAVVSWALYWTIPAFYVPWAEVNGARIEWVYLFILILDFVKRTGETVQGVPYMALGAEMSDIPFERNRLAASRSMAGNFGKVIGLLMGRPIVEKLGFEAFPQIVVCLLGFALVGGLLTPILCKERRQTSAQKKNPTFRDMARLLTFKPFMILTSAVLIERVGFGVSTGMLVFILRFWVMDPGAILTLNLMAFIAMVLSLFFWPRFIRLVGNKNTQIIGFTAMMILYPCSYFMFNPYDGNPMFTGTKIENPARRIFYKALTQKLTYTGADLEDMDGLKTALKADDLVGKRHFSHLDTGELSDAELIKNLNDVISKPDLYDHIKDNPYLTETNISNTENFKQECVKPNSLLARFVELKGSPDDVGDKLISLLNIRLEDPLFFEKVKYRDEFKELSKEFIPIVKNALPARLKTTMTGFGTLSSDTINLSIHKFSLDEMKTLADVLGKKENFENRLKGIWLDRAKGKIGIEMTEEKLLANTRRWLTKEMMSVFGFKQETGLMTRIRSLTGMKAQDLTMPLALNTLEQDNAAFLNRALLENAYSDLFVKTPGFNIQQAKVKKDTLVLYFVKTKKMRTRDFSELTEAEQRDVRMFNRLLLMNVFPDNIHAPVPELGLLLVYVWAMLAGFMNGCIALFCPTWLPDIADADELKTGYKRMASFFGVESFVQKLENSIMPTMTGLVLAFVGLRGKIDVSATPERLETIALSLRHVLAIPAPIFCFVSVMILLTYPLNNRRLKKMRAELEIKRRETAEE